MSPALLSLSCALVILAIFIADAVATVRADRASRKRVSFTMDGTLEQRVRRAGAP